MKVERANYPNDVSGSTERQQRSDVGVWRAGDVAEMMEKIIG